MKKLALICLSLVGLMPIVFGSVSAKCDQNFYKTLRYGKQYIFRDEFKANSSDKWLWEYSVTSDEQYDYNNSTSFPEFDWTDEIVSADYKVSANTTMSVLKAKSPYQILSVPLQRSYDNLLLTYTIQYSTDEAGNHLYSHTECGHYEISRCGDGVVDSSYGEKCDPKDTSKTGWGNGGCDNSCNPVTAEQPVCNSTYNGQRLSNLTESANLCTKGTVSDFKYNESTHKWTWKCNNVAGQSTDCSATKPYCGDGTKDAGETCDPKDPNKTGWGNGGCDNSCNPITIGDPVCNSSYNGQRVTSLVEGNYLCAEGTVSEFKYNESTHKWTWKCNNTLGKSTDCSATKPYCGDGTKDAGETCDPKDPNKTGWGEEGCSDTCEAVNPGCGDGKKNGNEECDPKDPNKEGWSDLGCDASCHQITVPSGCDETFYETLRYGHKYTFYDDFHANVGDKWLWKWVMEYEEQYDYNKSPDFPQFAWTTDLVNANYRVASNTTMRVLQATSAYPILAVPAQRAYDNLFIKYTLTYSTDAAGNNKYAHSECAYYEISRCGDGVLDTEYDEICDPKDPNHQGWGNGGCDDTCNPITVVEPDGKLKIEKTLVGSKEVKNTGDIITWNIKVTAVDGNVTNFIVTDKLPDILAYDSYTVIHNPGLTVGNPTVNGNNIVWKVTGTLKEGEYLEIQLKTKAKWMPKEDIVNVACVRPEDNPNEDCDEDDIPVDGKLKIEKILVGSKEVKNTGDIITWNIKVTAVDGNVTNFIVTDKLPDILAYDSYTVIHNPGLTVGNPTVNGNNIVWKVTGTLKEGEYLEIQLKTKAKWMPKEDIVNVACVRPENDPDEDCDEDDIPVGGKLKIEKTLVGSKEVKNVGDIITWNIKVTAVGGDVTNFIITDKLPEILGYSGYEVVHTGSVDSIVFGGENMAQNSVSWTVKGTLKENDYVEITLITYAKVMPEKDYKNVACVAPEDNPKDEDCDDEELPSPHIRIKKSFTDGSKTKTVKIGDEIGYKITFGNTGNASAAITSIKDFLPKNVEYVTGAIFLEGQSNHENTVGGEIIDILRGVHYNRTVDGVYIDIYTGITLKPGESGYIILTGKILTGNQDSRTNFACIYLNDKKVDCDDATHDLGEDMCEKLDVPAGNLPSGGGSKDVTCTTTSGAVAEYIEIDCGNGASGNRYITGSNIKSLTGTCSYPSGSKTYNLVCKVKVEGKEYSSNACKGTVTVNGGTSSCFIAGTKVTMADGSKKNIEDVKIGEKLLGENGEINTVIGYDRPVLGSRHLWSINGGEYFVSDEHPFKTTEGWKSFNPEMTKLEIDLDTTQLKIGDSIITENGIEEVKTVSYMEEDYDTQLFNFVLNGNNTYHANGYLVHNKGGNPPSPSCFIAGTKVTMADGSQKNIEDVEIGEKVLGSNGTVNTVLGFHRPLLGEKELWSINGGKYFVTAEHPFMTTEGWKSLNPELTKIGMENLPVGLLEIGDTLITENGNIVIYSLDAKKSSEDTQLYNFKLDGDHTYYADNYLVHNKGGSGTPTCRDVEVKSNGDVTCEASSSNAYFKLQCGDKTYYSYEGRSDDDRTWINENIQESKERSYTFEGVNCNSQSVKCSISQRDRESGPWTSNSKCVKAVVPEGFEQCFNVNAGNFSIEEGEIFPFFWNMHNLEVWIDQNKEGDVDWYDTIKDTPESYKKAVNNYEDYKNTNCETVGTIAKDSMVCTFMIYGGGETKPLYTIEGPCLSKESSLKKSDLIKAWYNTMISTYCKGSNKCYFSFDQDRKNQALLPSAVYYIENFGSGAEVPLRFSVGGDFELIGNIHAESAKPYGEYRIVLDNVKYLQCMGDEENPTWQQTSPEDYFTKCQNNFVLTDSYTVQKTPSGNLTASTDKLSKYKYLKGTAVFSELLKAVQATEYTPNDNVNKAMKKFVDKYSKLAVSVNVGKSSFLDGTDIKKVPGKSIYFVAGDITIKGGNNIDKPFTIVQTSGKTTIKGNVKHNMMLLTYGNIEFEGISCNEDQTVKGIFYAGGNLIRHEKYRNINPDAKTWCTKGGLHVQGVLIGKGFDGLMDSSRSHLNDWFTRKNDSDGGRSVVMNGASVLIEYSPSIFTKGTMPPGAEDFTTALSIYKN